MTEPRNYCIQLVTCLDATPEQRNDPKYIPQLKINQEAQNIISTQFRSPISVIVYVGDMGVGKSKLATVTVNTFYSQRPQPPLRSFRSGAGVHGVTHGIWMWADPLSHPSGEGSVLLLDCEGMGDIDEHVGANLYLFCMLISTSFAVLLRPARIQRSQCERLYHALLRFEQMKTDNILPNLWIIPLEMPDYIEAGRNENEDDKIISKEKWLKQIFVSDHLNDNKQLAGNDIQTIQQRYNYINKMLPNKNACNIYDLPTTLRGKDQQNLDIWSLLHETKDKDTENYLNSILNLKQQLLSTGGKILPGSLNKTLYIRPAEFSSLMSDLIDRINEDKMPNPDSLLDRYLRARFINEIVKEQMAKYEAELFSYVETKLCPIICNRKRPEKDDEKVQTNQQLLNEKQSLIRFYMQNIIKLARRQIFGADDENRCVVHTDVKQNVEPMRCNLEYMISVFRSCLCWLCRRENVVGIIVDEPLAQSTIEQALPLCIQNSLKDVENDMMEYTEPERLLDRTRENLEIENNQREKEAAVQEKAVMETKAKRLEDCRVQERLRAEQARIVKERKEAEVRKQNIIADQARRKAEDARVLAEQQEKERRKQQILFEQEQQRAEQARARARVEQERQEMERRKQHKLLDIQQQRAEQAMVRARAERERQERRKRQQQRLSGVYQQRAEQARARAHSERQRQVEWMMNPENETSPSPSDEDNPENETSPSLSDEHNPENETSPSPSDEHNPENETSPSPSDENNPNNETSPSRSDEDNLDNETSSIFHIWNPISTTHRWRSFY